MHSCMCCVVLCAEVIEEGALVEALEVKLVGVRARLCCNPSAGRMIPFVALRFWDKTTMTCAAQCQCGRDVSGTTMISLAFKA